MAIQVRRGKEDELDISKAVPGEWLVSTDTRYVRMCFAPGIVLRMATYEAFEADMAQIQAILEEAKTVEEAIQKIYDDVQQVIVDIETASNAAQIAIEKSEESEYFANAAASSASAAKTSETNAESSASSASTSASTATKKATEASTYANNAKNSENTANTHATTASNKASEASTSANTASVKANDASDSALLAESYTHGGTGVRDNEDVDNAEYYYEQAKQISQGMNGLIPMGTITFAELSNPDNQQSKFMFNISDKFTTDETFKGGAGYYYGEGTNVFRTDDGFWDALAPSSVSGVKGKNESTYRQGLVEITADNIGLGKVDNTSDADKPISDATQAALGEVNERIDESVLDLKAQIDATNNNVVKIITFTESIKSTLMALDSSVKIATGEVQTTQVSDTPYSLNAWMMIEAVRVSTLSWEITATKFGTGFIYIGHMYNNTDIVWEELALNSNLKNYMGYGKFYHHNEVIEITTSANGEFDYTIDVSGWANKKPEFVNVQNLLAGTLLSTRYEYDNSSNSLVKVKLKFAEQSLTFLTRLSAFIVAPIE